jgi:hypothetical protein
LADGGDFPFPAIRAAVRFVGDWPVAGLDHGQTGGVWLPFRDDPAAGALDVAVGSPWHHILRGLYGAVILGAGKIIACTRSLKEEICRTGS